MRFQTSEDEESAPKSVKSVEYLMGGGRIVRKEWSGTREVGGNEEDRGDKKGVLNESMETARLT